MKIDKLSKQVERISTKRGLLRNLMTTATPGRCASGNRRNSRCVTDVSHCKTSKLKLDDNTSSPIKTIQLDQESSDHQYEQSLNSPLLKSLAPHVADVSPTCRRHRQMSPNLGRHCVSLRHRRGPDIPNLCQLQPTSTSQPKRTS